MKKIALATALFGMLSVAHANGFNGFYVGADIGTTSATVDTNTTQYGTMSSNQTNFGAKIGYGATSGSFYLGVEAMFRNGAGDFGDKTATISGQPIKLSLKTENTRIISLIPGYVVSPNLMVYGRLARADADVSATATNTNTGASASATAPSGSFNVFGAGVDYKMTKNVSAVVEASRAVYDGGDANNFNVGVNYRF